MTARAGLEAGYRRLLACYPRAYWREHEEEMLAVLLAGARDGQRRPGLAESADLLRGALRIRLRPFRAGPGNPAWQDALAAFTVTAPLLLLIANLITEAFTWQHWLTATITAPGRAAHLIYPGIPPGVVMMTGTGLLAAGQLALAAAVLLRLRRVALTVLAVTAAYWIFGYGGSRTSPTEMFYLTFCLLEAAALIATPRPHRGTRLLSPKRAMITVAAAVPVAVFWIYALAAPGAAALIVLAVLGAGLAATSQAGRYLAGLFAIMLYPSAIDSGTPAGQLRLIPHPPPGWPTLTYLPVYLLPALTAAVIITTARRPRNHATAYPETRRPAALN